MKRTLILLAIGMIVGALWPAVVKAADDTDRELRLLRAENKMLKATLKRLDKEAKALREELKQLKKTNAALAAQLPARQGMPTTQASQPTTTILYKGKKRTSAWFDDAFKEYGGSYFVVTYDGKTLLPLFGLRRHRLELLLAGKTPPNTIESNPPEIGSIQTAHATVLQVLKNDEVLATVRESITKKLITIHIKGIYGKPATDGANVSGSLFQYLGPYAYVNTKGIKNTVQSYGCCRPPTKNEFAAGLLKGVVLKKLKPVKVTPNYKQKNWRKNLFGRDGLWFKIVETEAP